MAVFTLERTKLYTNFCFFVCKMFEDERKNLVKKLKKELRIKTDRVEKAFLETPREKFVPDNVKNHAYVDTPLQIGNGQTISAPHMVAIMCEALDIKKGQKILEIGAGSGYHAAIVSKIVGEKGQVFTVERFENLAETAQKNLESIGITNVTVIVGDGSEGLQSFAPYDCIYVTCASPKIPPPLIEQIKDGGKLLIPVGKMICTLELIEKKGNEIKTTDLGGCAFVPLVGKHGF